MTYPYTLIIRGKLPSFGLIFLVQPRLLSLPPLAPPAPPGSGYWTLTVFLSLSQSVPLSFSRQRGSPFRSALRLALVLSFTSHRDLDSACTLKWERVLSAANVEQTEPSWLKGWYALGKWIPTEFVFDLVTIGIRLPCSIYLIDLIQLFGVRCDRCFSILKFPVTSLFLCLPYWCRFVLVLIRILLTKIYIIEIIQILIISLPSCSTNVTYMFYIRI